MVALVGASLLPLRAQQDIDTSLPALLSRMGAYVDQYERELAAVVSEELYFQEVSAVNGVFGDKRYLKSDVLISSAGEFGWVAFRDVMEVDGKQVNDRQDRLINLFVKPSGDSKEQVEKIVAESARLNIGWVNRNINVPTMVLQFATTAHQNRSEFKRGGTLKIGEIDAREVRFQEKKLPRMIQTRDSAAASGKFWLDEATGQVLRTELKLATGSTTASVIVAYEFQPKLKLWLPTIMNERYATPRQPVITGRATYQNFRRFDVKVDLIIK